MDIKKNLILVDYDCPSQWKFVDGLSKSTKELWEVKKLVSNANHTGMLQNIIRYLKYFWLPFTVFLRRDKYKKVIGWQQFFGLILGFYCHLFHVKNAPNIYIMTFIYNRRSSNFGNVYEKFIKYCITSDAIKKIVVFSKTEPKYYSDIFGVDESLFASIDLGIEDLLDNYEISDNGRYLSAGRSNRDYDFLVNNWNSDKDLDIICDTLNASEKENIKIYTSIHNEEYFKMLSECHAVILCLKDENVSSGQLVIMQAMMLNKPVICTENKTVANYIDSGADGLIIKKDADSIEKALQYVEEHYSELTKKARERFVNKYTEYQMGLNIGGIVKGE